MKNPVRVAVTGAAGQIGYSLVFRIARGDLLGPDQPVILSLLEITPALGALQGVVMELNDCAFPLLHGIETSDDADAAFNGVNYALLVGSRPRTKGMERSELLEANGAIFTVQGKALAKGAADDVRILVVGNPANTNCLIAMNNAPSIGRERFTAMTRLDHNRAKGLLAEKCNVQVASVTNMTIWGNHSATQYPDVYHTKIDGKDASTLVDDAWIEQTFIPTVQQRGAKVIEARGATRRATRGQRRHRSRARLGARNTGERLGEHGRVLRRFVRRTGRTHLRLPRHDQAWRVVDRARARHQRVLAHTHRRVGRRTR